MFKNFRVLKKKINGININYRIGGNGPPILLLHGYPQTHIIWRKLSYQLSQNYTVICSDLRGYGDSDKPISDHSHRTYSKVIMAKDQHELMIYLGFNNYYLVGHDRGARVAHRMCLAYNKNIIKAIFLDIIPTNSVFELTNQALARKYYHWFFLIQKFPLPEKLIEANAEFYLKTKLGMWGNTKKFIEPIAIKEYLRCFSKKTIHASCEDYRAAASIDLIDHNNDKDLISCPILVLWGKFGTIDKLYKPISIWKKWASNVKGYSLECGHFLPEEKPEEVLKAIQIFCKN